jgi:hypothetical protein
MLHSLDKVSFEPWCVACFESVYCIVSALVTEPNQIEELLASALVVE